jgi:anti-sigma B factor antagonist
MITRGTTAMMATGVADARAGEQLELSHRVLPTGEAVAGIGGELDFATAEKALRYVSRVIDCHHGPVIVDLTALGFVDAQGLSALVRMAGYAERAGRPFRLVSPSPSVVKIMRITGLDRRFLIPPPAARLSPEDTPGRPPRPSGGSVGARRARGRATVTTT